MSVELYFLRSSEAKIASDMLQYAHENTEQNKKIYTEFYGLTPKDLGLYALDTGVVAGAIWTREIDGVPVMSLGISTEYRGKGIASQMMAQFFVEAGALYEKITVDAQTQDLVGFYEKFGFIRSNNADFMMHKNLEKKEIVRPTDGYDPRRWMD